MLSLIAMKDAVTLRTQMQNILAIINTPRVNWKEEAIRQAFNTDIKDGYSRNKDFENKRSLEETRFQLRVNADIKPVAVSYVALIAPYQDTTGPYGVMRFVLFLSDDGSPALICLVIGTQSIAPHDMVLGKSGHAGRWADGNLVN